MGDIDIPSIKERLWHTMQEDLAQFIPEVIERNRLMCCACGRFLPFDDFDVDHIIPRQALKLDPEAVRDNPATPANVRAGNILLCTKPLHYGKSRFYNNGCNSWKGKNFDGLLAQVFAGTIAKHASHKKTRNTHIIGGLSLAYFAMVARYGYVVALMQSGLLLREQFFTPGNFRKGLGTKFQAIFTGLPQTDPNDPVWTQPFNFEFQDETCLVTVRNYVVYLPVSRDPRIPIARHLSFVPQRYTFRPDFKTAFT